MKKTSVWLPVLCLWALTNILFSFSPTHTNDLLTGGWQWQEGNSEATILFMDDYCVFASYDIKNKKFNNTWGGPYKLKNQQLLVTVQFNSGTNELAGTVFGFEISWKNDKLVSSFTGGTATGEWKRLDNGIATLAGTWRISGRKQGEKINEIQLAPRRTLKILSGTRFQWAAINIDTKEFFGTGGGRYTFENGKYTEQIEFFSRDSSRVGASLGFDGKIERGEWHHSGLSSKGDPIYEIWKPINK